MRLYKKALKSSGAIALSIPNYYLDSKYPNNSSVSLFEYTVTGVGGVTGNWCAAHISTLTIPKDGNWYYWEVGSTYGVSIPNPQLGAVSNKGLACRWVDGAYSFRAYPYGTTTGTDLLNVYRQLYTTTLDVHPSIMLSPASYGNSGTIRVPSSSWVAPPTDIVVLSLY